MTENPEQKFIDQLVAGLRAGQQGSRSATVEEPGPNGHTHREYATVSGLTDQRVLELLFAERERGSEFEDVYNGDHAAHHPSSSEAVASLLWRFAFYTDKDPVQMERLIRGSGLPQEKFDTRRGHTTWLGREIERAIDAAGETYHRPRERRHSVSSLSSPYVRDNDDDTSEDDDGPKIVWFADLGEPKEREYLLENIGVKGYPIVAFGAGGVAKSFAMLSAGIAIASASGVNEWLGLRVLEHGHVLYLDFELDVEEQHRRVRDLCAGMGVMIPKRLAYLSGIGITPERAFRRALTFVFEHKAKAVIIDSMGLAMQGDMEKGSDVLAFHSHYVNPLRRAGATPFIVDHEGKLQAVEKRKDKMPFGSSYKAWASRSVLQFIFEEYREAASELDISVRQTKTNFGPKIEPIGVRFTFEEKKVSILTYDLPDGELVDEVNKPVKERILVALRLEGATIKQLAQITGATEGTIRNKLSELRADGRITDDGRRPASYQLVSSSPLHTKGDDYDDTSKRTVAELFANPPSWLAGQLEVYRTNPQRHFKPLCNTVAAVVLGDSLRGEEVAEEVERILEQE